jgi:methanesulfonate monooxygenase subunit alpha
MTTETSTLPSWAPPLDPSRWVDNRVYTDPHVYEREVERIFDRTWLFACHESEVRNAGDYFTTTLFGSPLVIVRGKDDVVRAFYNTCRHRGSQVVGDGCGHATSFRCPYHFWVFSTEGELIGIPGEEAYDGSGFAKENFPLVGVRCEIELGLVFVSFEAGSEPLRAWLGPEIVRALSTPLADARFRVIKYYAYELPVNWKVFAENARDGYHVPFVHPFFRKASPPGQYELYGRGHAVQRLGMDESGIDPDVWKRIMRDTLPGVTPGDGYIVTLFPDATLQLRSNEISIDSQVVLGPDRVRMESRVLGLEGDSPETIANRILGHATWFLDPVEGEDAPVFLAQQAGVAARGVRYSVIARGADATVGTRGDDNRLRWWWNRWRELMGTRMNSLADELG